LPQIRTLTGKTPLERLEQSLQTANDQYSQGRQQEISLGQQLEQKAKQRKEEGFVQQGVQSLLEQAMTPNEKGEMMDEPTLRSNVFKTGLKLMMGGGETGKAVVPVLDKLLTSSYPTKPMQKPTAIHGIAPPGTVVDGVDISGKPAVGHTYQDANNQSVTEWLAAEAQKNRPTKSVTELNPDKTPKKDKNGNPVSKLIYTDTGETVPNSETYSKPAGGFSSLTNMKIDPDAQEQFYQQWLTTGDLPRIPGMGGAVATVQMMNDFAKRAKQDGYTGQAVAAQKAVYSTAKAGLQQVTKMASTLSPNVETAKLNMDAVSSQLDKYKDKLSQFPLVNEYKQWANGERLTGDPDYTRYKIAIFTAVREYSKVVTGASGSVAGLSDFATKTTDQLLNVMQTPEAARAAMKQMKIDMDNMKTSWDDQQKTLRKNMQTQAPKSGSTKPDVKPKDDPLGIF
jgi:hypothetical protein